MLMILISQGAWMQTGIVPPQLLLNIWRSTFFQSLFSPLLLCPPSLLCLPPECLHWEIFCKGLPSLSPSPSDVFFSWYLLLSTGPWTLVCTCVFGWARVCDHTCAHCYVHVLRAKEAFQLTCDTSCLFSPCCEVESLKFRREPPLGNLWRMFRYTNMSAQETPLAEG